MAWREQPTPSPADAFQPTPRPKRERVALDILGGHDTPNPGGSQHIQQFISDLKTLGMHTAVCIDPSPRVATALKRSGVRMIVRLVQEGNVFDEPSAMWTLRKLHGLPNLSVVPFNEPNIEGIGISPEAHVRDHFVRAATIILPVIAPYGGTLLFTPLAPYAKFQGLDELEAFKRMLAVLREEVSRVDEWMWPHIHIGAHAYSYHLGDDRVWDRIEQLHELAKATTGAAMPIEITEAGLNIDYQDQYSDEQIMSDTVRLLRTPIPASLAGDVRSFCLWVTANYAQRDGSHQQLGEDQNARQADLDRFEAAALRRLDGVTPTYRAIASLIASARGPR